VPHRVVTDLDNLEAPLDAADPAFNRAEPAISSHTRLRSHYTP